MFYHWITTSVQKSKIINVAIYLTSVRAILETENDCETFVLSPFSSSSWIQTPSLGMFYHWTNTSGQKYTIINVAIYCASVRAILETENDCEATSRQTVKNDKKLVEEIKRTIFEK
jgi:hypothetical protein